VNYKGGSPLALENTMGEFLKNRNMLQGLAKKFQPRKTKLFEESDLLSEDNIKDGLD
jgi:hypothetical protein